MTLLVVVGLYLLLCLLSLRKFNKLLNPFILESYFVFLLIAFPQTLRILLLPGESSYIYSDLAIFLYFVFVYLGTSVNIRAIRMPEIRYVSIVNGSNWMLFALFVSPIIPIFLSFEFSIAGIRNFYESVVFSPYASFFELAKFFLYVCLIYRMVQLNRVSWSVWIWIPFFFLFGSKFVVFDFFMLLLLFKEYYHNLSLTKFVVYATAIAGVLIIYRYLQTPGAGENIWYNALAYFDQYKNQSLAIERLRSGEAEFYHGRIYFSSYLKYIPRIIWENKPRDFGFAIMNWDFMPKEAEQGYMPAFGLGGMFADFGYWSVAVIAFFSGLLKRYLFNIFVKTRSNLSFFLFALPLNFLSLMVLATNLFIDRAISTWGRRQTTD
ncbi:MAG: hypothetical protein ACOYXA_12510 [Bacteroidota bacterium]